MLLKYVKNFWKKNKKYFGNIETFYTFVAYKTEK